LTNLTHRLTHRPVRELAGPAGVFGRRSRAQGQVESMLIQHNRVETSRRSIDHRIINFDNLGGDP
jgi:hypothetical protein